MTINEILKLTGTYRKENLILFFEGNFCKCYNEHAMLFTENIKKMKVHTRFYKNVNRYIHSMGFPKSALPKYKTYLEENYNAMCAEENTSYIRIENIRWRSQANYEIWHLAQTQKKEKEVELEKRKIFEESFIPETPGSESEKVWKMVQDFRLETASPLDTFNFVQKLKSAVNK